MKEKLRVARDAGREFGRKRDRLVERVGVERLRVAENGGHRLDAGAGDVVERILLSEAPAGGLRVRAQRHRLGVFRIELPYNLRPEHARGAHLGDFHEIIHPLCPEE